MNTPLWLYRPVINVDDVARFCVEAGVKKIYPLDQLHLTLATVREPVDWSGLELRTDELIIPAGIKTVQIIGWTIKALTFGHPAIKERHDELVKHLPGMDHTMLRPHVSLFRGGKLPHLAYTGELHFGPEVAMEFNQEKGRNIKHIKHIKLDTPEMRERLGIDKA